MYFVKSKHPREHEIGFRLKEIQAFSFNAVGWEKGFKSCLSGHRVERHDEVRWTERERKSDVFWDADLQGEMSHPDLRNMLGSLGSHPPTFSPHSPLVSACHVASCYDSKGLIHFQVRYFQENEQENLQKEMKVLRSPIKKRGTALHELVNANPLVKSSPSLKTRLPASQSGNTWCKDFEDIRSKRWTRTKW